MLGKNRGSRADRSMEDLAMPNRNDGAGVIARPIPVTGGAGFIELHLRERLARDGDSGLYLPLPCQS